MPCWRQSVSDVQTTRRVSRVMSFSESARACSPDHMKRDTDEHGQMSGSSFLDAHTSRLGASPTSAASHHSVDPQAATL
jgi:hypothetical protein